MKAKTLKWMLNVYPPYLGTGIWIEYVAPDFSEIVVTMKLHWYNSNYVGTHFGGSLYTMVDPFYMLMMMNILGKEYLVWDKTARIEFVAPGRGKVTARFTLTNEHIAEVKKHTADGEKYLPEYIVEVMDEQKNLVAKVTKQLYIRKKAKL
ncbi:MAG: DUF4442 domain-containing protein [bacterium]